MIRAASVAALALCAACKPSPDPEAAVRYEYVKHLAFAEDAGAAFRLASTREVFFDAGWFALERDPKTGTHGDCWRWQGHSSLTRLRSHDVPMHLKLTGWVPYDVIVSPPAMMIRVNGTRALAFLAPPGRFTKDLLVSPGMQRGRDYVDLVIETSTTGTPKADDRSLGYALSELVWEPAP
jgi:hypothetical protein